MKLISVEIENLRCYQGPVKTRIDGLTTFIGKNDIGKSTILELTFRTLRTRFYELRPRK
ncbi:MAG: AAA family ATPase, partial [Desulfobacteria bacterium]